MLETETKVQRYKRYIDSGVEWLGEVPEHWDLTRLGTRFKERKTKVSDKDFPPLSVTKNGTVPQLANAAKSNDGDNRKLVKKGDFAINSRSDRKGSSGIAYQDGSVSLIYIVMEPLNIHPIYCNYLLKSYNFIEEFYRMGHGIVADLWTTRYDEMKAIMVGIPPLPEQTAIAQFLDDKTTKIDAAITIKQQQISLLKERKQILIHKAVTRGLDDSVKLKDSGVEWIGEIPEHWEVVPLRHIGKTQNGLSKGGEYFGSGYPFLTYGDVYKNRTVPDTLSGLAEATVEDKVQFSIKEGDVFFTRTSETVEDIAFASTCLKPIENGTFAGFLIRFRPEKNVLFKGFSRYYFSSSTHRPFFVGQMNLVIRASLSQDHLKRMPVLIPPLSEQKEISTYIETASQKIEKAIGLKQQEIEKLKEYKSSLINSVVTGKVKVY
jgi:type I restriction enzyme S subunit